MIFRYYSKCIVSNMVILLPKGMLLAKSNKQHSFRSFYIFLI